MGISGSFILVTKLTGAEIADVTRAPYRKAKMLVLTPMVVLQTRTYFALQKSPALLVFPSISQKLTSSHYERNHNAQTHTAASRNSNRPSRNLRPTETMRLLILTLACVLALVVSYAEARDPIQWAKPVDFCKGKSMKRSGNGFPSTQDAATSTKASEDRFAFAHNPERRLKKGKC